MNKEELELALKNAKEDIQAKQKELEKAQETNSKSVDALKGELKSAQDEAERVKGQITELGNQFDAIQKELDKKSNPVLLTAQDQIKSVIDAELKSIKEDYAAGKVKSFAIKAATLTTSIANSTIAMSDPNISPLASRTLTMYDLFNKVPVGADQNGTVRYWDWDTATTARAAAARAENAAFPESTAAWTELSISLQKIGDSIPFSEEFLQDSARFAAELNNFITQNVMLQIDNDLLLGDGSAPNIFGLDTRATAYTAAAAGITDASIYDLIEKVDESITTNKGAKYQPNVVLMCIADINKMKLKKDANNNYIMPPFVGRNGQEVGGKVVLRNDNVAANTAYVGDSRYGTIYESSEGYSITIGEVNAQFLSDMKTLKARKRLNLLIKNSEVDAWRKIASISAALTTLAT